MTNYTTPITNLNGTDRKVLHKEWSTALSSIENALDDLRAATCHGRDFQCQEPGTWVKAIDEKNQALAYASDALDLATAWVIALQDD